MNILFFTASLISILVFLYLGFNNKNIPFVVGGGILCILFGSSLYLSGTDVITEKCSPQINTTTFDGNTNITSYSYMTQCVNQTVIPNIGNDKLLFDAFALLFIILGAGFTLGKFVNE